MDGQVLDNFGRRSIPVSYMTDVLNPARKTLRQLWTGPRTSTKTNTGNEGDELETVYHWFVLVGVPNARLAWFVGASILLETACNDQAWFDQTIATVKDTYEQLNENPIDLAHDLLNRALEFGLAQAVQNVVAAFPIVISTCGCFGLKNLVESAHWPTFRDPVVGVIRTKLSSDGTLAACAVLVAHAAADEDVTSLLQMAVVAFAKMGYLGHEEMIRVSKKMLTTGNVDLARRVIQTEQFRTKLLGGSSATVLQDILSSARWLDLKSDVLAVLDKMPVDDRVDLCLATAQAVQKKVDESVWSALFFHAIARGIEAKSAKAQALIPLARKLYAEHATVLHTPQPAHPWAIPTAKYGNKAVEQFLQSNDQSTKVTGDFKGIAEARIFATATGEIKAKHEAAADAMRKLEERYGPGVRGDVVVVPPPSSAAALPSLVAAAATGASSTTAAAPPTGAASGAPPPPSFMFGSGTPAAFTFGAGIQHGAALPAGVSAAYPGMLPPGYPAYYAPPGAYPYHPSMYAAPASPVPPPLIPHGLRAVDAALAAIPPPGSSILGSPVDGPSSHSVSNEPQRHEQQQPATAVKPTTRCKFIMAPWWGRRNYGYYDQDEGEDEEWESNGEPSTAGEEGEEEESDHGAYDSDGIPIDDDDDEERGDNQGHQSGGSHGDAGQGAGAARRLLPVPSLGRLGALIANSAEANAAPFTFGGLAQQLPTAPGLEIDGVGTIALPVVEDVQVAKLVSVAREAPFGRGFDTVLDPAVRKTWEIEPDKVHFANPAWDAGIAALSQEIATKLGFPNTAMAMHLYKMLLYVPGGHFVKHRDTEKHDYMFATVVVQLPSSHEGGELVVYQDPDQADAAPTAVAHDFGRAQGTSRFNVHYAVHYADAEHELKPVISGYRLAMVYSLCWPANQPMPKIDRHVKSRIARQLASLARDGRVFTYFFDHHYTDRSSTQLGLRMLKGVDKARYELLRAASDTLPSKDQYVFLLAHGSRATSYGEDGYDWVREDPPEYSVKEWYDMNGRDLPTDYYRSGYGGSSLDISDMSAVLNPNQKTRSQLWAGPRTSTREYTGNAGVTRATVYKRYLMVAVPRAQLAQFTMRNLGERALRTLLLQDVRSDVEWFTEAIAALKVMRQPLDAATTVLENALQFNLDQIVLDMLQTLPALLTDKGTFVFSRLLRAAAWPRLRDPVLAVIRQFDPSRRLLICAPAVEALSATDLQRDLWEPLLQVALDALPNAPADLGNVVSSLLRVLFKKNDIELVQRVVSTPSFQTLLAGSTGSALLVELIKSAVWDDLQDDVLGKISHVPLAARFPLCLATAQTMAGNVDEEQWSPVFYHGLVAMPAVQSVEFKRDQLALWRVLFQMRDTDWLKQLVDVYVAENVPMDQQQVVLQLAESMLAPGSEKMQLLAPLARARYDQFRAVANRPPPAQSWAYPDAVFPSHPNLVPFLRSNRQTTTVQGFTGIADARRFASRLPVSEFNLRATPSGTGRNARVEISKTVTAAIKAQQRQQAACEQMRRLERFYGPGIRGSPAPQPPAQGQPAPAAAVRPSTTAAARPAIPATQAMPVPAAPARPTGLAAVAHQAPPASDAPAPAPVPTPAAATPPVILGMQPYAYSLPAAPSLSHFMQPGPIPYHVPPPPVPLARSAAPLTSTSLPSTGASVPMHPALARYATEIAQARMQQQAAGAIYGPGQMVPLPMPPQQHQQPLGASSSDPQQEPTTPMQQPQPPPPSAPPS
ncbi:hypothetical protein GGF32_006357 [Allomyces javanicus]|nr:hypothetical protein GGF32_006357 [Allomyces javanicus]